MDIKPDLKDLQEPLLSNNIQTDSESIIKPPKQAQKPGHKKILIGQTLGAVVTFGTCNFIFAFLDGKNFSSSTLIWTGFLLVSISLKLIEVFRLPELNYQSVHKCLFQHMNRLETLIAQILRGFTLIATLYLNIKIADFAIKAGMNIGIATSVSSTQSIIQSVFCFLMFSESLTKQTIFGIMVVLGSVSWLSIAKNVNSQQDQSTLYDEQERRMYQLYAIGTALLNACINAFRVVQSKYIFIHYKYPAYQQAIDSGFISGIFSLLFSLYFIIIGDQSQSWYNLMIALIASTFMMATTIMGLNATVHGPTGPTQCIISTHCVFTMILAMIFLSQIPNIQQFGALFCIIAGVGLIVIK